MCESVSACVCECGRVSECVGMCECECGPTLDSQPFHIWGAGKLPNMQEQS